MDVCMKCNKELVADEIGLHKKLFNRGATSFMCVQCVAAYFDVSQELLQNKIEEFRASGCTLFIGYYEVNV